MPKGSGTGTSGGVHPHEQNGRLTLARFQNLLAQLKPKQAEYGQQHHIQQHQTANQNEANPFLAGTSFRGTSPEIVSRTWFVFDFGFELEKRI